MVFCQKKNEKKYVGFWSINEFGHVKEKSAGHYLYIARTFSQEKSFVFVILSESFLPHRGWDKFSDIKVKTCDIDKVEPTLLDCVA